MAVAVETLQAISALAGLSPDCLERLAQVMVRREVAAGEIIFLEGNPAHGIWFIAKGRVRIIRHSTSGRIQAMCMASAGKCFGGCPLFDGEINPASAQAVDDVTLLILPAAESQRLTRTDPHLARVLLTVLSQRLAHLARLSEGLGTQTVASRIVDCLLAYADHAQSPPVVLLTHDKLAILAGTTREVVSRHLARLEANGLVRLGQGRVVLLEIEALSASRPMDAACVAAQIRRARE